MDVVFFNGRIHTLDAAHPLVEALSVSLGRVVETGRSSELLSQLAPGVRRIDLGGRTVIPALTDAHAHLLGYAEESAWLELAGTASLDDILGMISARLPGMPGGGWILGRGWDQNDWPVARYPGKAPLDRAAPDNPVYLVRVCGHAAFVNSLALRIAGITRNTPDPPGGRILKDPEGEPTGILLDNAVDLVSGRIPPIAPEERRKLLAAAVRRCLAFGLAGVHEMGISARDVSLCRELYAAGELPFRVTAYLSADDPANGSFLESGPPPGRPGDLFRVVGAKFYADGSLGARSAALLEDYSDEALNRGILMKSPEELYEQILPWYEKGFQCAVHAIGDAAVREALDVFARLEAAHPAAGRRNRIEHAQVVSAPDIRRFAALGVIPSMQFTHCTSDMPWVEARLGPERIKGAYAWRSLISAGSRIPGGSDFPVESPNPFPGIYAAVTRQDASGRPEGGWRPSERLTVEEAVGAFTVDAAYAAHAEASAGSLSAGLFADFVVISGDVFSMEPRGIAGIRVLATVLAGRTVYRADDF
ncbi:MAG: amidohydrolase [Candidatus Krumholzibacteriaceae bacterium]